MSTLRIIPLLNAHFLERFKVMNYLLTKIYNNIARPLLISRRSQYLTAVSLLFYSHALVCLACVLTFYVVVLWKNKLVNWT